MKEKLRLKHNKNRLRTAAATKEATQAKKVSMAAQKRDKRKYVKKKEEVNTRQAKEAIVKKSVKEGKKKTKKKVMERRNVGP